MLQKKMQQPKKCDIIVFDQKNKNHERRLLHNEYNIYNGKTQENL